MENTISYFSGNTIKLSEKSLEELLEPIPQEILIEKISQIKNWKTKKIPFENNQTKREYFVKHVGSNLTLAHFRELRILREHSLIHEFKWHIFTWDKSIARYFPDKLEKKIEEVIHDLSSMVNIDLLLVDEKTSTVFLLLEMWQKEVVADTFLSKVETNIPKYFRAYISISKKMLLVEDKNQKATDNFINIFQNAFSVKVEEFKINAMIIREFVKTSPEKITRLVVRVPQEVAGFGGLSELTLSGKDVLSGSKGLMNRHETTPIDVGPWSGVSNPFLDLNVRESVIIRAINSALWLFDLIKELS
ncbi:MAG: hypothetical protein EAX90_03865 [Candidatus Heimdallarchaeota archaeon]|nr:hypothetical protein [Candidatus Heimdallarchaeota archaeon]